jgi:hypothetical protein
VKVGEYATVNADTIGGGTDIGIATLISAS